jgi:hypothetical protein
MDRVAGAEALIDELRRYLVPVFTRRKNRNVCVGTGFFLSTPSGQCLVSAAHVFDHHINGEPLFYYIETNTAQYVSGQMLLTRLPPGGTRRDDRLDVGVVRLNNDKQPPFEALGITALPFTALACNYRPQWTRPYITVGYPSSRSHQNAATRFTKSEALSFNSDGAPLHFYAPHGFSVEKHILLNFNPKRIVNERGERIGKNQQTNFHGMSGAPLFVIDPVPTQYHILRVVGVMTEDLASIEVPALVATDASAIMDLLRTPKDAPAPRMRLDVDTSTFRVVADETIGDATQEPCAAAEGSPIYRSDSETTDLTMSFQVSTRAVAEIIDRRLVRVPPTIREKFPEPARLRPNEWIAYADDAMLAVFFVSGADRDRALANSGQGLDPFPGLITHDKAQKVVWLFNKTRFALLRGCNVAGLISFNFGPDSSAILVNHSMDVPTAELGRVKYTIPLAYLMSFGEITTPENIYQKFEELVSYSVDKWTEA